ncbi:MAG: hypothetical protein ACR2I2_13315 [Bryobacteraceae bacterium]
MGHLTNRNRLLGIVFLLALGPLSRASFCQQANTTENTPAATTAATTPEPPNKRIFWIIPNFRSSPVLIEYKPLTPKEKFKIATLDSFDRGTVALGAAFAGESQLSNSNPSFGQGVKGYAHYFATAYTDFVVGDFMTEGIYPALLHQDPRYFRRGKGSALSRLGYSAGQIFWTHKDSGGGQFNFSEVVGNSTAVAISMAYYPENRSAADGVSKLGNQLAVDMVSNILKEFWPDLDRKFSRKHHAEAP